MAVLVTGVAGFIGYHVAAALLARGERVLGLDNLNDYYDIRLKQARLDRLSKQAGFAFARLDVADREAVHDFVAANPDIDRIVHLAAQAGVRHSLVDPYAYVQSNVMGHLVIQEAARRLGGSSTWSTPVRPPFTARTVRFRSPRRTGSTRPFSIYAATKRADELMSYAYGHLFGLPQTGPSVLHRVRAVGAAGHGLLCFRPVRSWRASPSRSTTTAASSGTPPISTTSWTACRAAWTGRPRASCPSGCSNIGNHRSELVSTLIALLEQELGREAIIHAVPRPRADVEETFASVDAINALTGYVPRTPLAVGIPRFVSWFRNWHSATS